MDVINRQEMCIRKNEFFEKIENGAIFIHPTDTIYGLGCNAKNENAVERLRQVKMRSGVPFSVIAPSKKWIVDNCIIRGEGKEWVNKLPGPYTLILRLANPQAVAANVNLGSNTLGVRIPKHWFSKAIEELGVPIVTTSANISGEEFMTSIDNLDRRISSKIEFAIYEGEKKGKPSTIVNLADEYIKIIER